MYFSQEDFNCFHPSKTKNAAYNEKRLAIRRKLQKIGKTILPFLEECDFEIKTSLHHPFMHNSYNVVSQWVYFIPSKKNIKEIKKIFGSAFFEELKSGYNHTFLLIGIDYEGLFISLKTNAKAWWDGQNVKNKCSQQKFRSEFHEILNTVTGFTLRVHDFKKSYSCGKITSDELNMFLKYYSPGEHWIHLDHHILKKNSFLQEELLVEKCKQLLVSIIPVYKFIKWSSENNYVFKKKT